MARLAVRLTPRGGADRIEGVGPDGALRVRVTTAPVDGRANEGLARLLAEALGVPVGAVAIERGRRSRSKLVHVEGVEPAVLVARWPGLRAD